MKKENIIAIVCGVGAGVFIAILLMRQAGPATKNNDVILKEITPTISIKTTIIEPLIIQSPESDSVVETENVTIQGTGPKEALIVLQSPSDEAVILSKEASFSQKIGLFQGKNPVRVTSYDKKNIESRTLNIFSIIASLKKSDDKNATKEEAPAEDNNDSTINELKKKIEKKVDELSNAGKNVVSGVITSIDDDTIKIKADNNKTHTITLDDTITEMYELIGDEKETIDVDDVEKGDYVVVSGPAIEDQISANILYKQSEYIIGYGQITSANKSNFSLDVVTSDKEEIVLDIEDDTVQNIVNASTLDVTKAGFSKFKAGDTIHFVYKKNADEKTRFSATRVLIIPQEYFVEDSPAPTEGEDES